MLVNDGRLYVWLLPGRGAHGGGAAAAEEGDATGMARYYDRYQSAGASTPREAAAAYDFELSLSPSPVLSRNWSYLHTHLNKAAKL